MPDKNFGLTVDAEIAELIVAAWLEALAKLNLPNSIRARAHFVRGASYLSYQLVHLSPL